MQEIKVHGLVWRNVITMVALHALALFSLTQFRKTCPGTVVWELIIFFLASLGITAGVHRLWSHRSYKAKLPLRIILVIFNSMAIQNSIFDWVRDHRGHHKYTETDADPHNAKRGFFFSHIGWLLVRKHPDVIKKGKGLDLSDLFHDPVIMFQHRHYPIIAVTLSLVFPTVVPMLWGETLWISFLICLFRICYLYNVTWTVNSLAHIWGNRPYDKYINPAEHMLVSFIALGEGFHNYHHVFPHDYRTSEFGIKFNLTTAFIDIMTYIGLAYDCRKVEESTILARRKRTGDLQEKLDVTE